MFAIYQIGMMKSRSNITFVPDGGLANRMRAIAAAIRLSEQIEANLEVIWFQDWGLKCDFEDLFLPIDRENVHLRNATMKDKLFYDRPRRRNFHLPVLFQKFLFDVRVGGTDCQHSKCDFMTICRNRNAWLSSCYYFFAQEIPKNAMEMFKRQERIQEEIDKVAAKFGNHTVGVHIRRTDSQKSIVESPTHLFVEKMKQEPDNTIFYLATDSEEEKKTLKDVFGENRIITSENEADRFTVSGMMDAMKDLYLLAKTDRILGSYGSSFSEISSLIGKNQLEIIRKL